MKAIKFFYYSIHAFLHNILPYLPWVKWQKNGKPILLGHISKEHLQNPNLDIEITKEFESLGIAVHELNIDKKEYNDYISSAQYPNSYYGGGLDTTQNFTEKTLEHYVSTLFMKFSHNACMVDIAACTSPFAFILKNKFGVSNVYQQDLVYTDTNDMYKIGGYAHELSLPDNSIDNITLHCSLEHFENDSDTLFFETASKKLKVGGSVIVLPFYLAHTYTIHTDPVFNFLRRHRISWQKSDADFQQRYCRWLQFFSRHYSANKVQERILKPCPNLQLSLYRVTNYTDIDPTCYLRWVGVFTRIA